MTVTALWRGTYRLFVDREGIGIGHEIIAVHIVAGRDAGRRRFAAREGMAGILRDAPEIDITNRIQHYAAVFIQQNALAYSFTDNAQPDPLRLHRRGVRFVVVTLDGAVIH